METMGSLRRTNYCGEVSMSNVGQEMTVCGSIARARDKGGIIFADLRDTTGILQLVFDEDTPKDVFAKAESLKSEYVVICRGLLRERAAKTTKIATGGAHLCSIQYYLRFWLSICRTSLAVSALRIMRYCPR